jgi:hypothetical protein
MELGERKKENCPLVEIFNLLAHDTIDLTRVSQFSSESIFFRQAAEGRERLDRKRDAPLTQADCASV